jgi:hypothetical protein
VKIDLLEKEPEVAMHTTGRNSGVLHAGIYYQTSSFKEQFCRIGNQEWTKYCDEHKLPIRKCGKMIIPKVLKFHNDVFKSYYRMKQSFQHLIIFINKL